MSVMPDSLEARSPTENAPAAEPARRGHHKIFVGMAAGVGKTYRALGEIRELFSLGKNAVVGILETHGRAETQEAARGLPVFPRRELEYKGTRLTELDLDGLLKLHPDVVMVDDLAHANAPDSRNARRYEDVRELLDAGIDVISTVNIQHLESLNDLVAKITGVRVKERLPDQIVADADEVILVDVTPQLLRERIRAGKIYSPDKVDQALKNFFTDENLTALRELALRQVADAVQGEDADQAQLVRERILVAISAEPESGRLIRRGGRIASRFNGDLHIVYVETGKLGRDESKLLEAFKASTEDLGGTFHTLKNRGGVGRTLVQFVREHHVTQVVLGESSRSRFQELLRGSVIHTVLRETSGVDVYVLTRE
ncbi:two-component system sensor histidine kinase KdpD [Deinococcus yavapaiensis KR-236]|uniref:Two-component system sensor histidine kinase KdpD n=2 Tax=Deinococcus TaxID=1298 RepID=A0A318SB09_9DEIO|nr:two-component system sensor histidine kinase KdpD [Deinococcus yavapaiensis KR-236]